MADLSNHVFLSQSRMTHLFKQETGITIHNYLAFQKLRKTYARFALGDPITNSCMSAGFNSPSHFSATFQQMFGIFLRDVYRTIATK